MNSPLLFVTAPLAALLLPVTADRPSTVLSDAVEDAVGGAPASQVRIERRVIIRVGPSAPVRQPRTPVSRRVVQQPAGNCVTVGAIGGVEPTRDNRLLLFMRDQRLLAAELTDGCRAAHFYAGFYMENSDDGQLCVGRDHLHARDGSDCQVTSLQRLVAAPR
ncbi:hypothetical protein [Croceibacterium mercuriale]|uniref:hypothetical protein n=1 Tax=Croceibacterium mercuriale TaxID=1572751 RepID=UPI00068CFE8A|nr:hypothetical protein [Croceibacterium mercuriale]